MIGCVYFNQLSFGFDVCPVFMLLIPKAILMVDPLTKITFVGETFYFRQTQICCFACTPFRVRIAQCDFASQSVAPRLLDAWFSRMQRTQQTRCRCSLKVKKKQSLMGNVWCDSTVRISVGLICGERSKFAKVLRCTATHEYIMPFGFRFCQSEIEIINRTDRSPREHIGETMCNRTAFG